jgi:hypothetical protein
VTAHFITPAWCGSDRPVKHPCPRSSRSNAEENRVPFIKGHVLWFEVGESSPVLVLAARRTMSPALRLALGTALLRRAAPGCRRS